MAGLCACRSLCQNPSPIGKDELVGAAPIEESGTPTPTPVMSRASTPAPATAFFVASYLDNGLFKQFINTYFEAQVPGQTEVGSKPRKQFLKDRFLDVYYDNLYMDCY